MSLAAMTLVLAAQGMALVSGPMIGFDTQVPHKRIRRTAEQIAADEAAKAAGRLRAQPGRREPSKRKLGNTAGVSVW